MNLDKSDGSGESIVPGKSGDSGDTDGNSDTGDQFQIWSPDGATCINYTCIATLHWIVLLTLSVSIELVSSSARVASVKFQKGVSLSEFETTRPIDRTRDTWVR